MSAGIVRHLDRGLVGFCDKFGGTWHQYPEYVQITGPIFVEDAIHTLDYIVHKIPISLFVPEYIKNKMPENTHGKLIKDMYVLVREDTGTPVYNVSVSDDFEVFQNKDFLTEINDSLLKDNPSLNIESVGSLFGGRIAFVNLLIDEFAVKKDCSKTVTRLMYYNAFGGKSLAAMAHNTRVVCANTLRISEAQGAVNETLRKFKHTKNAPQRLEKHMIDLSKLFVMTNEHKEALNHLSEVNMTCSDVELFLGNLFDIPKKEEENAVVKNSTRRENKKEDIKEIFETAEDLQGEIKRTRYAMLQACTNYSQYRTLRKDTDIASAWYDAVREGGTRQKFNQKAFDLLMMEVFPELKSSKELVNNI